MSFKNVLMLRQGTDESKEDDLMWGDYRRNLRDHATAEASDSPSRRRIRTRSISDQLRSGLVTN
jgi:hypothetical protein